MGYYEACCEIIQIGEKGWDKQPTTIREMYDDFNLTMTDKGFPYDNKYYWVGLILSLNNEE